MLRPSLMSLLLIVGVDSLGSDLRQVPDTQEVFLYPDSGVSIIFEVLQRVDKEDDQDAARFHFESVAHDNDAKSQTIQEVSLLNISRKDDTPSPVLLNGTQTVAKFNRTVLDEILILLALYRIPSKNVDFVMTMNIPIQSDDSSAVNEETQIAAKNAFNIAARSLHIVDFALFA